MGCPSNDGRQLSKEESSPLSWGHQQDEAIRKGSFSLRGPGGPKAPLTAAPPAPMVDPVPPSASSCSSEDESGRHWAGDVSEATARGLLDAQQKLSSLPKAMAALVRFQRRIANSAKRKAVTHEEVERGVRIQKVFDFYDPETKKIRVRKINEKQMHMRKTVAEFEANGSDGELQHSPRARLTRRLNRNRRSNSAESLNSDPASTITTPRGDRPVTPRGERRGGDSPASSPRTGSQSTDTPRGALTPRDRAPGTPRNGNDKGTIGNPTSPRQKLRVQIAEEEPPRRSRSKDSAQSGDTGSHAGVSSESLMNDFRRTRTKTEDVIEVVTVWGVLAAKLLHTRVLKFSDFADTSLKKRRMTSKAAAGKPMVMQSVLSRASLVVQQAKVLTKQIANETEDVFDSEWRLEGCMGDLFSSEFVDSLFIIFHAGLKVIAGQGTVVRASAPCRIYGDTHGQLRDVLMLFHAYGWPDPKSDVQYVFNGDFVDRGKHQIELLGLLLAFKLILPEKVWLVRGNHEDKGMNVKYGFQAECTRHLGGTFGPKIFTLCVKVFDQLPIACVVSDRILVVHGGIGDARWSLDDLTMVKRPLNEEVLSKPSMRWISGILWSDPIEDDDSKGGKCFGVHSSPRGSLGKSFGWNITKTFCARHGLSLIVRSHQSKHDSPGFDVMHENLLMRVFSARDYEGHGNDGAIILVEPSTEEVVGELGKGGLTKTILSVRPQVLRSTTKARNDASRAQRRSLQEGTAPPGRPGMVRRRSLGELPADTSGSMVLTPRPQGARPRRRSLEDIGRTAKKQSSELDRPKSTRPQRSHQEKASPSPRAGRKIEPDARKQQPAKADTDARRPAPAKKVNGGAVATQGPAGATQGGGPRRANGAKA